MNIKTPKVSVIMSLYNEPIEWVKQSINSILFQTFKNFEFIIVLDNPKRIDIEELIIEYQKNDKRIIFIKNETNLGLAKSLNKALTRAKGEYIARMDGDDISLLDRLEKQLNFLEKNKDIDILGTAVFKMDKEGKVYGIMKPPITKNQDILKKIILSRTIAFHPTWMVRKIVYEKLKGYRPFRFAQDYDFLLRALDYGFKVYNLEEPLLKYRIHMKNISFKKSIYQYKSVLYAIQLHKIRKEKGYDIFKEEEYQRFIKTSKLLQNIHTFSTKMFIKAMQYRDKKKLFLFILLILISMVSPYQLKRFFNIFFIKKFIEYGERKKGC